MKSTNIVEIMFKNWNHRRKGNVDERERMKQKVFIIKSGTET